MTKKEFNQLMVVLERIAKALEAQAYPFQVTYTVPEPVPTVSEPVPSQMPHIPNPYWNPPTYQPIRFEYFTGDPLPRPQNTC